MRMYVLLILAAIFLSISTAYYAISLQQKTLASKNDINDIEKFKKEFVKNKAALIEIDLSAMYPSSRYTQLLSPMNVFSRETHSTKAYFSKPCLVVNEKMSQLNFEKSEIWESFRCNRIKNLANDFFDKLPLIHESGLSYAYLAFLSGRSPFDSENWVRANLNLFHVYELEELPIKSLEGNFQVLSRLKKIDLESLLNGSPTIITDDSFIVRNSMDINVTYKFFPKIDLENFFLGKYYFIKPYKVGEQCFYRDGRFCWEKSSGPFVQVFMQSSILLFSSSVLIIFLIIFILFKKIKLQKFEEERKKHALRVLTHELRTPISNLLLQVERINQQSDLVPSALLDDFLKMEGEVYRLKRLAEKSTSYLQTHDGPTLISFNYQSVSSINDLMYDMLEDYLNKGVVFIPAELDQEFKLDVYWFNICVKNLVENALFHGKKPVRVELMLQQDILTLKVIDHGENNYKTLDEILLFDRIGKSSTGLGLGLSIVQKIMKEMEGRLTYSAGPTTFTLLVRNKK